MCKDPRFRERWDTKQFLALWLVLASIVIPLATAQEVAPREPAKADNTERWEPGGLGHPIGTSEPASYEQAYERLEDLNASSAKRLDAFESQSAIALEPKIGGTSKAVLKAQFDAAVEKLPTLPRDFAQATSEQLEACAVILAGEKLESDPAWLITVTDLRRNAHIAVSSALKLNGGRSVTFDANLPNLTVRAGESKWDPLVKEFTLSTWRDLKNARFDPLELRVLPLYNDSTFKETLRRIAHENPDKLYDPVSGRMNFSGLKGTKIVVIGHVPDGKRAFKWDSPTGDIMLPLDGLISSAKAASAFVIPLGCNTSEDRSWGTKGKIGALDALYALEHTIDSKPATVGAFFSLLTSKTPEMANAISFSVAFDKMNTEWMMLETRDGDNKVVQFEFAASVPPVPPPVRWPLLDFIRGFLLIGETVVCNAGFVVGTLTSWLFFMCAFIKMRTFFASSPREGRWMIRFKKHELFSVLFGQLVGGALGILLFLGGPWFFDVTFGGTAGIGYLVGFLGAATSVRMGPNRKRVGSEWPLDKAQSFLGQGFTPLGVRHGSEDNLAGYFFHFLDGFP